MDWKRFLNILLLHALVEQILCGKYFMSGESNPFTRAVTRKKRFVVFSNYASMKITAVTGKHLISKYPRRVNFSLEVSVYYPLPTKLEEWYPQRYRSTTSKPPVKSKNVQTAKKRIFVVNPNQISTNRQIWDRTPCYNEACFSQNVPQYQHHPEYIANYASFYKNSTGMNGNSENYNPVSIKYQYHDGKVHKVLRAHRDRRSFYRHLEQAADSYGVKFRACVLRMICEVKHYLLPPGYSLFQDILRIFFTLPTLDNMDDEYTKALRHEDPNCSQIYGKLCPISILELVLNPKTFK